MRQPAKVKTSAPTPASKATPAVSAAEAAGLALPRDWSPERGLNARQAEALRKMLLAVASDPRLMMTNLEEQLARLRAARELPGVERERLALQTRFIFAPLANRLGAGELKWQLEDFAFRYLETAEYHRIATALSQKRADRERYVEALCATLGAELERAGVTAEVHGRAKHIYGIHRKMQRKQQPLEKMFDVLAVRVLVAAIPECYAALGVVHGLWAYIPGEFDDYIATPKSNAYRSIHTAIVGPQDRTVEVQIRTHEMHGQAEHGGAPHWKYKEGGPRDERYDRKIDWLRRLLAPAAPDAAGESDLLARMSRELFADRVYPLTPKGEVVELPRGATPVDFAYAVHTDLGHRCRGAKVNGRIVPLTNRLANGEVVEIITGKEPAPSRHWLIPSEGYLAAPRSRAKLRAWFKRQDEQSQTESAPPAPRAAPVSTARRARVVVARPGVRPARSRMPVEIEGIDALPTTFARCCHPVRPDAITGYFTLNRGVTVHQSTCAGLARMRALKPQRIVKVSWAPE